MLHYNYVIFNSIESKIKFNPNGYYAICYNDLRGKDDIQVVDLPLQGYPKFLRCLYSIHHSVRLNRICKLPFKKIWYPIYFKKQNFSQNRNLCFILQVRLPISYLKYLKKKYPKSKFVSIYRDLRKVTEENNPEYPGNPIFDLEMTIDRKEASKFGWTHFEEFESKITVPITDNYPESDVFFAGKAKDRLPRLLKAYEILSNAGLKCKYYLTGVPVSDRKNLPGIEYSDRFMQYSEMLYHTVNSRCILEINQENAVGYTSRFLEAVMFNKRLITDNLDVKKSKFYSKDNIQVISEIDDISVDFINGSNEVNYNYNNEFSPLYLLERIDKELVKRNGKQ